MNGVNRKPHYCPVRTRRPRSIPLLKPHAVRPSRRMPTANDRTAIWRCTETKYQRPSNKPKKLISQQGKNKRKVDFTRARSRETIKSQEPKTVSSYRLTRARWSENRKEKKKEPNFKKIVFLHVRGFVRAGSRERVLEDKMVNAPL